MDGLALYAAIVGSASLAWQIISFFLSRRSTVRVADWRVGKRHGPIVNGHSVSWEVLSVELVNTSDRTLTVDGVWAERPIPYRARFVSLPPEVPGMGDPLLQGETARFEVRMEKLEDEDADRQQPVHLHVRIASGETYIARNVPLSWTISDGRPRPKLRRLRSRAWLWPLQNA